MVGWLCGGRLPLIGALVSSGKGGTRRDGHRKIEATRPNTESAKNMAREAGGSSRTVVKGAARR